MKKIDSKLLFGLFPNGKFEEPVVVNETYVLATDGNMTIYVNKELLDETYENSNKLFDDSRFCIDCDGTLSEDCLKEIMAIKTEMDKCKACEGRGVVDVLEDGLKKTCQECNGTGKVQKEHLFSFKNKILRFENITAIFKIMLETQDNEIRVGVGKEGHYVLFSFLYGGLRIMVKSINNNDNFCCEGKTMWEINVGKTDWNKIFLKNNNEKQRELFDGELLGEE